MACWTQISTIVQTLASEDPSSSALCVLWAETSGRIQSGFTLSYNTDIPEHKKLTGRGTEFFFLPSAFSRQAWLWRPGWRMQKMLGDLPRKEPVRKSSCVDKAENTEWEYTLLSWQRSRLNAVTVTAIFIHLVDMSFQDWSFWSQSFWTLGYWARAQ